MISWEKLKSEYIFNFKWLKMKKDTVKINDELIIDDYYVTENNDVVIIFPVIDNKYVMLEKEYCYPLDKITLGLPGGFVLRKTLMKTNPHRNFSIIKIKD